MIDGYAEGDLDKAEAEPRIRHFKERLQVLETQREQLRLQTQQQNDLQLVISRLEEFSVQVREGLEQLDWAGRRELIRTLVNRVEIEQEHINLVFRINESIFPGGNGPFMHYCGRAREPVAREPLPKLSLGPLGGAMARSSRTRGCHHRALLR